MTSDTLYEAASLSKPVLGHIALRLHEAGDLDLDRPLAAYVTAPDLVRDPRAERITTRHVLSHSSGLPNWRFGPDDDLTLAFAPGTRYSYSGEGIYWLQRVVEHITAEPLDTYAHAQVFHPLGMRDSRFTWAPDLEGRLATGHDANGAVTTSYGVRLGTQYARLAQEWGKPLKRWTYADGQRALTALDIGLAPLPNFMMPNAAGSLITTPGDYARFVANQMTPHPDNPLGLKPETLAAMQQPQVSVRGAVSRGLGWGLEGVAGRTLIWHSGDNVFFRTFVVADLAARLAIVAMTNGANGNRVYTPIVRDAVGHHLESLSL